MPYGWEGNRRSLVTSHASRTELVYPPAGSTPNKGDEHSAYTLHGIWNSLPVTDTKHSTSNANKQSGAPTDF